MDELLTYGYHFDTQEVDELWCYLCCFCKDLLAIFYVLVKLLLW